MPGVLKPPIIDFSLFELGQPWRDHLAAQIDWAASEFGFFYVVGHGLDSSLAPALLQSSRSFFELSAAEKLRLHMSRGGRAWRGYFPVGAELTSGRADHKEGLYFGEELSEDDERVRAALPLHGRNLFPELPGFTDAVLEYMRALTGLGHQLMICIARGLHLPESYFYDRYTGNPTILFRIFNYPPLDSGAPAGTLGVGEHTDYGLLTVLFQDDVGGLQVRYGSEWLEVPPVPGSFVVNVGDMLERLTSGRYVSALHRVRNTARKPRISMPFFFDPSFDAILEPIAGVSAQSGRPAPRVRWDGLDLQQLRGTYGEYLLGKVSKVFPELGRSHLSAGRTT